LNRTLQQYLLCGRTYWKNLMYPSLDFTNV
jgi:hypothetical protein